MVVVVCVWCGGVCVGGVWLWVVVVVVVGGGRVVCVCVLVMDRIV